MTLLQSKLSLHSIQIHLSGQTKMEMIAHLVDQLCKEHSSDKKAMIVESIEEREKETSTYIGEYCAIPHAHIPSLQETRVIAASLNEPIAWDENQMEVLLVFLLIGPPRNATTHLRLLSQLTRILHDKTIRNNLIEATTQQEFYSQLFSKEA
jgi:mannitol/fructose-specific phosphotransferase system IIA component (Ntr-type)